MINEFLVPTTPAEAVSLKSAHPQALYLAGGSWVNTSYSGLEPATVISLQKLGLKSVEKTGDTVKIGACVTIQDMMDNADIPCALKQACAHVGSRNIRNQGTIGGNISAGSPWFSITPALLALHAKVTLCSESGERDVELYSYITGKETGLVTAVTVNASKSLHADVQKYTRTHRTVPVIVAAASLQMDGDKVTKAIIAIGGVSSRIVRITEIEDRLIGAPMPDTESLEKMISARVHPTGDFRGSADLRKYMAGVLAANCLVAATKKGAK